MAHNYNEPTTPTLQDQQRKREQQHADKVPGSCLGAGCCPECGRPVDRCQCQADNLRLALADAHREMDDATNRVDRFYLRDKIETLQLKLIAKEKT
jgi:hypothetical protein